MMKGENDMFGKNGHAKLLFDTPEHQILIPERSQACFVEFRGATGSTDDEGRLLEYVPRDNITVNVARISGFYDHTILVDGRKIRVMETYSQIALKILEAMR
jgi:hypothetical protein